MVITESKESSSSTAWTHEEAEELAQELNMQHLRSSSTTAWTHEEAEEFAQKLTAAEKVTA